jgi:hypothetical protein
MKDLLKPTEAQIKYRNRLWAQALLDNKKKTRGVMYEYGARCCLAVAQDVAVYCGVDIPEVDQSTQFPAHQVSKFFGWGENNPDLNLPGEHCLLASCINDGGWGNIEVSKKQFRDKGLPHNKIAECVLNTFVHPSKKKWSFNL